MSLDSAGYEKTVQSRGSEWRRGVVPMFEKKAAPGSPIDLLHRWAAEGSEYAVRD